MQRHCSHISLGNIRLSTESLRFDSPESVRNQPFEQLQAFADHFGAILVICMLDCRRQKLALRENARCFRVSRRARAQFSNVPFFQVGSIRHHFYHCRTCGVVWRHQLDSKQLDNRRPQPNWQCRRRDHRYAQQHVFLVQSFHGRCTVGVFTQPLFQGKVLKESSSARSNALSWHPAVGTGCTSVHCCSPHGQKQPQQRQIIHLRFLAADGFGCPHLCCQRCNNPIRCRNHGIYRVSAELPWLVLTFCIEAIALAAFHRVITSSSIPSK